MLEQPRYHIHVSKKGTTSHRHGEMIEFIASVEMHPSQVPLKVRTDTAADLDYPTRVTIRFALLGSQIRGKGEDVELQEAHTAARKLINALHRSYYPEMHERRGR